MKLTKAMREYVEGKVREQEDILIAKVEEEYADYYLAKHSACEELKRMCEEMNTKVVKSLEEKGLLDGTGYEPISYITYHIRNNEIEKEIARKKSEIKAKTNTKLRNLLLEIELGAAKSEFLDIVNNFSLEV